MLPRRILFTGAPGSKWSGIAQTLEQNPQFNTTDRTPARDYSHHRYAGHKGAYFGHGMEFEANCTPEYTDQAWTDPDAGTMLVKSHEWALDYDGTKIYGCDKTGDWFMLVYRPNDLCMEWWQAAGGFGITYPKYDWYEDNAHMAYMIRKINEKMLRFAAYNNLTWEHWGAPWVQRNLGIDPQAFDIPTDLHTLVTIYKP